MCVITTTDLKIDTQLLQLLVCTKLSVHESSDPRINLGSSKTRTESCFSDRELIFY